MLLTSVVLLLQETLEAALLIAVLAALGSMKGCRASWLPWGLGIGLALGYLYAGAMGTVSEWFDYVGQEVVNALLQITIALALGALAWTIAAPEACTRRFRLLAALAVVLAVTREGSEVLMYLGGFLQQGDAFQAVLLGSGIGFGIGLSLGILLFYSLFGLPGRGSLAASVLLLALFAGNMLAQAALQLIQADWLASAAPAWDTSSWISEQSVTGQLLYALIGYEATPAPVQVAAYLFGVIAVLAAYAGRRFVTGRAGEAT